MYKRATFQPYISPDTVNRRAGGRRRINAERKRQAWERRLRILDEINGAFLLLPHGMQTRLAARFGVSRSTICRDIEAIREEWRKARRCGVCGEVYLSGITLKAATRLAKIGLWDGCTSKRCAKVDAIASAILSGQRRTVGSPMAKPGRF